ncbi:MAG TPA: potassium channel family protein [Candidatus Dormibacteraeota bacterium]|jgi:hypothetical protein|nr:potassium channel family protein [Candidatus Dormibacteraeota bacterium]
MSSARLLEMGGGIAVVIGVVLDLFSTVLLPRPSAKRWRVSRVTIVVTWRIWRWLGERQRVPEKRESFLGTYAPILVLLTLVVGIIGLIFGYGLILDALRSEIKPPPEDFATSLYFSAISLLTLGFGDYVPVGIPARVVVLMEAATGLGTVAIIISFLFSLYGSFQKREIAVVELEASAGAPPSGLVLLETYGKLGMVADLGPLFATWRTWSAEVLESHLAYPILGYFRSSHDRQSWLSALGAVLDAATLMVTAVVEDGSRGQARLTLQVGGHLVEDLARFYGVDGSEEPWVEQFEFDEARERLAAVGFKLKDRDKAWEAFRTMRSHHAGPLNELARHWTTPPALWIGDRSVLGHRH